MAVSLWQKTRGPSSLSKARDGMENLLKLIWLNGASRDYSFSVRARWGEAKEITPKFCLWKNLFLDLFYPRRLLLTCQIFISSFLVSLSCHENELEFHKWSIFLAVWHSEHKVSLNSALKGSHLWKECIWFPLKNQNSLTLPAYSFKVNLNELLTPIQAINFGMSR